MNSLKSWRISKHVKGYGPAMGATSHWEVMRAGLGVCFALGIATSLVRALSPTPEYGLFLIAPFGATAILIFAIPTSPLAQPWSALVGNTVSALTGVLVVRVLPEFPFQIPLAVSLAVFAMFTLRAFHPPAGAIAMTVPIYPSLVETFGYRFAITPVATVTLLLILTGVLYGFLSRNPYPNKHNFRSRNELGPGDKISLNDETAIKIPRHYRQSLNLDAGNLASVFGGAEQKNEASKSRKLTASDFMSTKLICVGVDDSLTTVTTAFRKNNVTSIPVIDLEGRFKGVIHQSKIFSEEAGFLSRGLSMTSKTPKKPCRKEGELKDRAEQVMTKSGLTATPSTHLSLLLLVLAEKGVQSIPIVENGQIVGIVTQTDILAGLVRLFVIQRGDL
ncbi:HPP family protein [Gemmobacter caeruleus]|uniref:HPP family protein n=1 Tax=Gemmobacter caeruleus TaxID=2595004 RepID=UPI0011EBAA3F|nr:HPP family protein [Gemmobacter caeruleus]